LPFDIAGQIEAPAGVKGVKAITIADGMVEKVPWAGSQCSSAAKDKSGARLDAGKSYPLLVPANAPVKDFGPPRSTTRQLAA